MFGFSDNVFTVQIVQIFGGEVPFKMQILLFEITGLFLIFKLCSFAHFL